MDTHDLISVGGKSGTFIFLALQTKWFELDPMKDGWTHNPHKLIGKKAQIEVSGAVAMRGHVDIVSKVFDKYNQGMNL